MDRPPAPGNANRPWPLEPPLHVEPTTADAQDPRRWKALALLAAAFFMVILDATIVLTAIPSMQDDLALTVSGVQWIVTGYSVTFGGLMLFFGRVADLMGRRRVFGRRGNFVVSSLLCGVAWTGEVLIASRALQGASAAIMAPTALSIVVTTFTDAAERNKERASGAGSAASGRRRDCSSAE